MPTDPLTRSTNHAHSLTHSLTRERRVQTEADHILMAANATCRVQGKSIVPFRERQEGNSVGRFDPRLLSFLRVPFNSLLEYWERQMARKTDQRWRETVSIQPPTEVLFRKEEKLFPSRSQSVLNSKLSCGQLNTVIFRCWS